MAAKGSNGRGHMHKRNGGGGKGHVHKRNSGSERSCMHKRGPDMHARERVAERGWGTSGIIVCGMDMHVRETAVGGGDCKV